MKSIVLATLALAAVSTSAHALSIGIDAELLKTADGQAMSESGLVVLTAVTNGSQFGPTATSFTGENEIVLGKWDLSAFATPGVFDAFAANLSFIDGWNENDPLRLYWYPTLTLSSTAPGAGTSYGTYSDAVGLDGSAAWLTPTESATISLYFYTNDATFLSPGGSNDADAGLANLTVSAVPEPSNLLYPLSLAMFLGVMRRRVRWA